MPKQLKKTIEIKSVKLANGVMTMGIENYNKLNKRFADLTTVTIEEALIAIKELLK
jgi:hypothetical protein